MLFRISHPVRRPHTGSTGQTHQDQLAVLADTAEAVPSSAGVIECDRQHERRVTLASSNYPVLLGREDGDEVVLSADRDEPRVRRPRDAVEGAKVPREHVRQPVRELPTKRRKRLGSPLLGDVD